MGVHRLLASLAILILLSPWAPHRHTTATTEGHVDHAAAFTHEAAHPVTVSSDDAHHEHSSTTDIDTASCPVCRSNGEREGHLGPIPLVVRAGGPPTQAIASADSRIRSAHAIGLPPSRAPPIG